jgi:hypothetical protein
MSLELGCWYPSALLYRADRRLLGLFALLYRADRGLLGLFALFGLLEIINWYSRPMLPTQVNTARKYALKKDFYFRAQL